MRSGTPIHFRIDSVALDVLGTVVACALCRFCTIECDLDPVVASNILIYLSQRRLVQGPVMRRPLRSEGISEFWVKRLTVVFLVNKSIGNLLVVRYSSPLCVATVAVQNDLLWFLRES